MLEPLKVIYSNEFEIELKQFSTKEQKAIKYDLEHQTKDDIARVPFYKGFDEIGEVVLRFFMEYKKQGKDYRIMLMYCANCYPDNEIREYHNCPMCDENILNRIVVFTVYKRPKAYRHYKFKIPEHFDL